MWLVIHWGGAGGGGGGGGGGGWGGGGGGRGGGGEGGGGVWVCVCVCGGGGGGGGLKLSPLNKNYDAKGMMTGKLRGAWQGRPNIMLSLPNVQVTLLNQSHISIYSALI